MAFDFRRIDRPTFLLIILIFVIVIAVFWELIGVVFLAASLAVVVTPLQRWFSRRWREDIAAIFTTTVIFFVFLIVVSFTLGVIYQNIGYILEIVNSITAGVETVSLTDTPFAPFISQDTIREWSHEQIQQFGESLGVLIQEAPVLVLQLTVFFLALFLFIWGGPRIAAELMRNLPRRMREAAEKLSEKMVGTLYAVYVVEVAIAVITFFIAIPFFYFLGYGHVLFFSVISGIFQLVPFLGQTFVIIVLAGYAFINGDVRGLLLLLFVGYPLVAAFPDAYLRPLLMGKRVGVHPVIMWIGIFGGIEVMGAIGFILGPVLLSLIVAGYQILIEELKAAQREDEKADGSGSPR